MIKSFGDKRTSAVFLGETPKGFPSDIANVARRKLRMLDQAKKISDLRVPPSNHLEATARDNTASASMTSGACASAGKTATHTTLKLRTITEIGV